MCRRVSCEKCGKPTYSGCGRHVEDVLGDVPREERCRCREQRAAEPTLLDRVFRSLRGS